jgi:hypothetical protein
LRSADVGVANLVRTNRARARPQTTQSGGVGI